MPNDSKYANTVLPSVIGELEAQVLLSACPASCGSTSVATRSQTVRPVLRSMAYTTNRCAPRGRRPPRGACWASPCTPTGTADETNTRSPQTIGDELPRPGISTFHLTFFVSLHSSGGFAVDETPVAWGPRHWAQNRIASDCCAAGTDESRLRTKAVRHARLKQV